jgi:hypothetical protein
MKPLILVFAFAGAVLLTQNALAFATDVPILCAQSDSCPGTPPQIPLP